LLKDKAYSVPAIVWLGTITLLMLLPGKDLPEVEIRFFDKYAHIGVFFLLVLLWLRWDSHRQWHKGRWIIIASILYGGLIELLQGAFYIDRFASWGDALANAMGCLIGYLIFPSLPKGVK
jgi:VanZ family protein